MLAPKRVLHRKVQRGSMKGQAKGNTSCILVPGASVQRRLTGLLTARLRLLVLLSPVR